MRILNYDNYKTVFSSLISICIIIFTIIYVAVSFIEFINQRPLINYFKSLDNHENKTFNLIETFIMFKFDSIGCINKDNFIAFASFNNYYNNINYDISINILVLILINQVFLYIVILIMIGLKLI